MAKNWKDISKKFDDRCTATKPLMLYIPPGETRTIPCPVHPEGHKVSAPDIHHEKEKQ